MVTKFDILRQQAKHKPRRAARKVLKAGGTPEQARLAARRKARSLGRKVDRAIANGAAG